MKHLLSEARGGTAGLSLGAPRSTDDGGPLVRDLYPELLAELVSLLEGEGERELALSARDLRIVEDCGCGDDFCQSFRTASHPAGQPYGPGHRCVCLLPSRGMLNLDVVDGRIMYVEVLDRPPLRTPRRPDPPGTTPPSVPPIPSTGGA